MAGIDVLHVPYKGGGWLADMIAGRIDMQFNSAPTVAPHVKAGRMRGIALARASRWPDLVDVPTFAESGWPQFPAKQGGMVCAHLRRHPRLSFNGWNPEAVKVVTSPWFHERLAVLVADPVGSTPQRGPGRYIRNQGPPSTARSSRRRVRAPTSAVSRRRN